MLSRGAKVADATRH